MKRILLVLLAMSTPAAAQIYSGPVVAIDGDTLDMTGERIRLLGIDAPELKQSCQRAGEAWQCGEAASERLANIVTGKQVDCTRYARDTYGRILATCGVNGIDIGDTMVRVGLAIALPQFSEIYGASEAQAKAAGRGIWASEFEAPADFRAARPSLNPRPPVSKAVPNASRPSAVYYRNCAEARAAGAAPIYRGSPGYRPEMDGDGDGIACEPYRGRR